MIMHNTIRKERVGRAERLFQPIPSQTFTLRKLEGIPVYNGSLTPVSSFSERDHDDITTKGRRTPNPPSSCGYRLFFTIVLLGVLTIVGMQVSLESPSRLVRRVLERSREDGLKGEFECPVCNCESKNQTL
jgi:hypothetical protein